MLQRATLMFRSKFEMVCEESGRHQGSSLLSLSATSNDPWGPTGTEMSEIAQLTFNGYGLPSVVAMCTQRWPAPTTFTRSWICSTSE